jgi:peptidoglycan hydrolase-like protein with peptidoglycan-binding domain
MTRTLALLSATALLAAVSGCSHDQTSSNSNFPPPATPTQTQQAAAQTNTAAAPGNTGTGMSNQAGAGESTGMPRMAGKPSQREVRQIQAALRRSGERVKVDGRWGPKTSAALRDYQQKNGLQASGELDDATLQKLNVRTGS